MNRPVRAPLIVAFIALVAIVAPMAVDTLSAQSPGATEYQVKAAYLYNFGRFVEWPAGVATAAPFTICVVGRDPFGQILEMTFAGLSIDGKPVVARRVTTPQDATTCRILFISSSEALQLNETLASLEKSSVLTVSDMPGFVERGGAIQFVHAGSKIRFEINLTSAQNAGLVLSSDLLKVAIAVRKHERPGD